MAESFYGGRAGHDFTIYYCYSSKKEMEDDFKKIDSHTPIGGYCLLEDGSLYAAAANIEGNINATSGKIGNWSVSTAIDNGLLHFG